MDIFHIGVHQPPLEDRKVLCVGVRGEEENIRGDQSVTMAQTAAAQEGWAQKPWFIQGVGPSFPDGQKGCFYWFENRADN